MQIKKVDWINRPGRVRITAHTLTFSSNGVHKALYTLEENGSLELSYEGSDISFYMLHTPCDEIFFTSSMIHGSMFGMTFRIPGGVKNRLAIEKEGAHISFFSEEKKVFEISHPAFTQSASFGFVTGKGTSDASLSFF